MTILKHENDAVELKKRKWADWDDFRKMSVMVFKAPCYDWL